MAHGFITGQVTASYAITASYALSANTVATASYALSGTGKLAQVVVASTVATGSTPTVMVLDDSIPQNTEGEEVVTVTITPTNSNSILKISVCIPLTGGTDPIVALFKDSDANAIYSYTTGYPVMPIAFVYEEVAGSTTARTYKVRAGATSGTFYWNQRSDGRKFGGTAKTELIVEEILP